MLTVYEVRHCLTIKLMSSNAWPSFKIIKSTVFSSQTECQNTDICYSVFYFVRVGFDEMLPMYKVHFKGVREDFVYFFVRFGRKWNKCRLGFQPNNTKSWRLEVSWKTYFKTNENGLLLDSKFHITPLLSPLSKRDI